MLKYYSASNIVFQEVPDEVSLAIEITNCKHKCKGCHSPHLQTDIGDSLTSLNIKPIIDKYHKYISCILFMGGEQDIKTLNELCNWIKTEYNLKTAIYSGMHESYFDYLANNLSVDYIKVGRYEESLGGLESSLTNQKMYAKDNGSWIDITDKFKKKFKV